MRLDATSRRISPAYRKPHTRWQHRAALTGRHVLQRTSTTQDPSAPESGRPAPSLVVIAALIGVLGYQRRWRPRPRRPRHPSTAFAATAGRALGQAGGAVPDGVTVFDDEYPGRGQPRSRPARCPAPGRDGCRGRRGRVLRQQRLALPAYQEQLLDEAVSEYGSEEEAARWVATPETSPHVSGDAVDIGPADATAWLSEHGAGVRAVPDLRQRALALRAAPRGRRRRLPAHVRRPHAGSADAAVRPRACLLKSQRCRTPPRSRVAALQTLRRRPVCVRACALPARAWTTPASTTTSETRPSVPRRGPRGRRRARGWRGGPG